jgi:hypothetical protein
VIYGSIMRYIRPGRRSRWIIDRRNYRLYRLVALPGAEGDGRWWYVPDLRIWCEDRVEAFDAPGPAREALSKMINARITELQKRLMVLKTNEDAAKSADDNARNLPYYVDAFEEGWDDRPKER